MVIAGLFLNHQQYQIQIFGCRQAETGRSNVEAWWILFLLGDLERRKLQSSKVPHICYTKRQMLNVHPKMALKLPNFPNFKDTSLSGPHCVTVTGHDEAFPPIQLSSCLLACFLRFRWKIAMKYIHHPYLKR